MTVGGCLNKVYGYIRVSTLKQGEGVSLVEQKSAIERYAVAHGLDIIEWFEEKETAAKQGRPLFTKMLKKLKAKKASGVVIHKIDRSARNLKDWTELGDLIDEGINIHFAHESLDLTARSGRLSADIQAVIAADYIRNLRDESIKGLYGRLKQGVYPFKAPVGYLDSGSGNPKVIDPIKGPIIQRIFEIYATGKYNLRTLLPIVQDMGLKNIRNGEIDLNRLSRILNNPFYIGIMKVKGQVFKGKHEPLTTPHLFEQVQAVLSGKRNTKGTRHSYRFRKMIRCSVCNYSLIAEKQKGFVYYRCHTKGCNTTSFREDRIEGRVLDILQTIELQSMEFSCLAQLLEEDRKHGDLKKEEQIKAVSLQLENAKERIARLTDAYLDKVVDKEIYFERKERLLYEQHQLERRKMEIFSGKFDRGLELKKNLELALALIDTYKKAISEEKRDLVQALTSNIELNGKSLAFTVKSPFYELSQRSLVPLGDRIRDASRKEYGKIVFIGNNTSLITGKPLTKEQLRKLLEYLLSKCKQSAS